ncbi:MAG: hypothetical protein J6W54_02535 [Fibrobacter sp.]|uniref:hypothetical protein n=1 Tax=Fibrobacter sp. TaxID=35828 RepID=UPI001B1B6B6D|nr:hypothetical protein [Fibrobacter sp.]MBO7059962.1 hypothetical protein [Fibrobacter sp.]
MTRILKISMAASLLMFAACSDDKVTGAAIEPNTMAQNSSSTIEELSNSATTFSSSSIAVEQNSSATNAEQSSSSTADFNNNSSSAVIQSSSSSEAMLSSNATDTEHSIVFSSKPTKHISLTQGDISVYGEENGAEATCSVGNKSYMARFSIGENRTIERTIFLQNFGSNCSNIFEVFKNSCPSGVISVAPDAACNEVGTLKVLCHITNGQDSIIDFETNVNNITNESNDICRTIALDEDIKPGQNELPSNTSNGVDVNSSYSFVLKPNVESLTVSESERKFLDSLASAYPQKISSFDSMEEVTHFNNFDAEYKFTTEKEEYYAGSGSKLCNIEAYRAEHGLNRIIKISSPNHGGIGYVQSTILQVSDSAIVYLASAIVDNNTAEKVVNSFKTECEATAGSYHYYYREVTQLSLAIGCAVKNISGIPFETILSEQNNLCKNEFEAITVPNAE